MNCVALFQYMIDNVRERLFRGICCTREEYESTIQQFIDKKDLIYQTIPEFEYIDKHTRNEILTYIDEFFIMISCLHY